MIIEGSGTYGIVVSSPRIPMNFENNSNIQSNEIVSKILFSKIYDSDKKLIYVPTNYENFIDEYTNLRNLSSNNPNVFNLEYFIIPIDGGSVNLNIFTEYVGNSNSNFARENFKYYFVFKKLLDSNKPIYQIIFPKASKINLDFDLFFSKISNVIEGLSNANLSGYFFDDLKLDNLIYHNEKIKIIDYSFPVNLNLQKMSSIILDIVNSKFNFIFYYSFCTMCSILTFDYIRKIDIMFDSINYNYDLLFDGISYNYHYIINIMKENQKPYIDYKIDLFRRIIQKNIIINDTLFNLSEIKINLEFVNLNNQNELVNIDISLIDILNTYNKLSNLDSNPSININLIIALYKLFLNNKCKNFKSTINFLLEKNNIYSFGMILIEWIAKKINYLELSKHTNSIKLIKLACICCSNIVIIDNNVFTNNIDWTDAIDYYYTN